MQRDDDTEEAAMTRIQVYKDNIKPIQDLYDQEIILVDGNVGMDAVFNQITSALDQWCA
jgi:adenylate kinase family enzyme